MIDPNLPPPPRELGLTNSFRPQGYYTTFKEWPIYPNSSNQYWGANDVVRFYNTIDSGVMDPYRSSIQFVVQVTDTIQPVGQLQIDKLATSFFSQAVVSSKNVQIERIAQYDTLCAMLSDLGTSQVIAQGRSFQGMGYTNTPTSPQMNFSSNSSGQVITNWNSGGNGFFVQNTVQNSICPTRVGSSVGTKSLCGMTTNDSYCTPYVISGQTPSHASIGNYLCTGPGVGQQDGASLASIQATWGRFNNIRAQYNAAIQSNNYPDSNNSLIHQSPEVLNQVWTTSTMLGSSTTSGFNASNPYQITIPSAQSTYIQMPGTVGTLSTIPTNTGIHGYTKLICPDTCKGGNQATISATVPSCQMYQGQITTQKFAVTQKKFTVPFFSAVVGCLIPPDQFLLIQMKALKDLLVQLTLSPWAMFTSGYCDVHQFDQVGMGIQQKRNWVITNISWNIHLYTFGDSAIVNSLNASLVKGIPITSSFYFLGNTFQLPNGQVVRNMWPISCQSQSLSEIYCIFLSNQYQKYSFCRKQFRLSNNITSMQVRLKTQYYPSQPIIGNAGNPQYYNGQPDNSAFLKQLYWSNNYVFNLNVPMPRINKINFAINGRCYNTANTATYYPAAMYNNSSYVWSASSVNMDTAMGMPSIHQNRYIGMAIYSWTWDPYGHSGEYMTGINTSGNQNFAVQFTTSAVNPFPSDQTLVIFCRSNGIVIYSQQGIKVVGR